MKDRQIPVDSRDLYVIVEAMRNRIGSGAVGDPSETAGAIRMVIELVGRSYSDQLAQNTLAVANSLVLLGLPAVALDKVRDLFVLRGQ